MGAYKWIYKQVGQMFMINFVYYHVMIDVIYKKNYSHFQ
jgi:hypothetical protein